VLGAAPALSFPSVPKNRWDVFSFFFPPFPPIAIRDREGERAPPPSRQNHTLRSNPPFFHMLRSGTSLAARPLRFPLEQQSKKLSSLAFFLSLFLPLLPPIWKLKLDAASGAVLAFPFPCNLESGNSAVPLFPPGALAKIGKLGRHGSFLLSLSLPHESWNFRKHLVN